MEYLIEAKINNRNFSSVCYDNKLKIKTNQKIFVVRKHTVIDYLDFKLKSTVLVINMTYLYRKQCFFTARYK